MFFAEKLMQLNFYQMVEVEEHTSYPLTSTLLLW